METAKLYELALWASLTINGTLATYFLSGIKTQLKSMRKEMADVKEQQAEHKSQQDMSNYRITCLEADYKDLPCMDRNIECTLKKG